MWGQLFMEIEQLGLIFRRISHAAKKETDNNLKRLNLTMSQGLVLEYLNNTKDEELTQKAIEQHFNLQHPTVSGILKRLEKHGFITTSVNKTDRRVKDICLTEKARQIEEIARKDKQEMEEVFVRGLSAEDIETLRRLLKKVLSNMTGE
jgi:DNA-binding MarR family transcriptional regulator